MVGGVSPSAGIAARGHRVFGAPGGKAFTSTARWEEAVTQKRSSKRPEQGARLIGLDRDPQAIEAATRRLAPFGGRVQIVQANFAHLEAVLDRLEVEYVDGVLLDLGVSSHQLDEEERGFRYQSDAPLDMRMGPDDAPDGGGAFGGGGSGRNRPHLARLRRRAVCGADRWFIDAERRKRPIQTTGQLVEIVKAAIPARARRSGPHPAKRTFQALRIAVNDELGALAQVLDAATNRLRPGGRLVVISFHSLEDRIVKRHFVNEARGCTCPPEWAVCQCRGVAKLETSPESRCFRRRLR